MGQESNARTRLAKMQAGIQRPKFEDVGDWVENLRRDLEHIAQHRLLMCNE
jgi:hypothetical protein